MEDTIDILVKDFEMRLLTKLPEDKIKTISDELLLVLKDYDVTKKVTELAIVDDYNERMLKNYAATLLLEGKSKRTVYLYIFIARKFSDTIHKNFNEMSTSDVKIYLALAKKTVSNRTLENYLKCIKSMFTFLINEGEMDVNPCDKIGKIKYRVEKEAPFSSVDIDAIRAVCTLPQRAIVETLISSGIRISELVDANISDINFNDLSFYIPHGKGDKPRTTYITPVAAKYIREYLSKRKDNNPSLFIGRRGDRYTVEGVRAMLVRIGKAANVENVHPHRFRHTMATSLADKGMPLQEIQNLLGHTKIETTLGYISVDRERVSSSYRRFSN